MKVLVILTIARGITKADLAAGQVEEQKAVWSLYERGILRQIDLRTDRPGAVLQLEVDDETSASAAAAELPLVQDGRLQVETIPLAPFTKLSRLWMGE